MKAAEVNTHVAAQVQRKPQQPFFNRQGDFFSGTAQTPGSFFQNKLQAKLSIGQPGDKYEKEADDMAEKVAQTMGEQDGIQAKPVSRVTGLVNQVQSKCAHCEEEEEKLQTKDEEAVMDNRLQPKPIFETGQEPPPDEESNAGSKCAHCGEEEKINAKQLSHSRENVTSSVEEGINNSKGNGTALPQPVRVQMETAFGADFSAVNIHNDTGAADMNKELNAQAFTHGSDIYFNSGKYDTGSKKGQNLLAHELTHVVQQGKAPLAADSQADGENNPGLMQPLNNAAVNPDNLNNTVHQQAAPGGTLQQLQQVIFSITSVIPVFSSAVPQLQLRANPARAPRGLTCTATDIIGTPGTTDIFFTHNGALLDAAATTSIEAFSGAWVRGGLSEDISIDGYASKEGRESDNWRLSCNRAAAVHAELVRIGVPTAKIATAAHGPTEDFDTTNLEPNRRATIKTAPGSGPAITPAITPADNFAGRSTTRFGLSETLNLDYSAVPGIEAAEHFGVHWTVVTGAGTMVSLPSVRIPGAPFLPFPATYTAGNAAATEKVALTVIGGTAAGFNLTTVNLPLVAPAFSTMAQVPSTGLCHTNGMASAGFRGNIFMLPTDVSFSNIQWREGNGTGIGSGSFSGLTGRVHPTGSFMTIGPGNIATGCQVNTVDSVSTSTNSPSTSFFTGTDWTGTFIWPIAWQFQAPGGPVVSYMTAFHVATADRAGNTSQSKAGAGPFTTALADPTSCVVGGLPTPHCC